MRRSSILIAAAITVLAAGPARALTSQQQLMKTCNAEAKDKSLAGSERSSFMKTCLKGGSGAGDEGKQLTTQQQKMRTCNEEASGKKLSGSARKEFMSSCLKGS